MKCFMHNDVEAIATCRKCGKAMCASCSAYSGHSGICPQCRRQEFAQELNATYRLLESAQKELTWNRVKMVLLCWTIIYPIAKLFANSSLKRRIEEKQARIDMLRKEIAKLDKALVDRGTIAFI